MRHSRVLLHQRALQRPAGAGLWCAAVALALCGLRAGGPAAVQPCQRPPRGSSASPRPSRRGVLLSLPAGLVALGPAGPAWALVLGDVKTARAEIGGAATAIRGLQSRWAELEKGSAAAAGDAVTQALSSNVGATFEIEVPAGSALGVDIEGLEVVAVTDRSYGWQVGDKIELINGEEVTTLDKAKKKVNAAREANQPIQATVRRLTRSPFVTLERSLRAVYQDSDRPLPDIDDVMKKVASLRSYAPSIADGFVSLGEVKPGVDGLVSDLNAYVADEKPRSAPAQKPSGGGGGGGGGDSDMGGLFG